MRILFGNFQHRSLARHQDALLMELSEHPQGTVGHYHLILSNLRNRLGDGWREGTVDQVQGKVHSAAQTLTGTPRMCESWSALVWRRQFPALVTNTTGTVNWPRESINFSKAFRAAGIGILPRTSTPSMSNRSPKRGCGWGCGEKLWN